MAAIGTLQEELARAKNLAEAGECEGGCEKHHGAVKAFRVRGISSGYDWGYFSYCEGAVAYDLRNGFSVEEHVEEQKGESK